MLISKANKNTPLPGSGNGRFFGSGRPLGPARRREPSAEPFAERLDMKERSSSRLRLQQAGPNQLESFCCDLSRLSWAIEFVARFYVSVLVLLGSAPDLVPASVCCLQAIAEGFSRPVTIDDVLKIGRQIGTADDSEALFVRECKHVSMNCAQVLIRQTHSSGHLVTSASKRSMWFS